MSFLFPKHRRSWRPRSCGCQPVSSIPPQCVYLVAYGGPVFGQRACGVRCRGRAGSRESMVAGACGGCQWLWPDGPQEGGGPMHAERAAARQPCRIGTGPQRTGSLRSRICARMVAAKKACAPFGDTGKKQAGEGEFEGKALSHRRDRMTAPRAVPVSGKDASRDHRQRGGGSETQRRWRYGPDGHRRQDAG